MNISNNWTESERLQVISALLKDVLDLVVWPRKAAFSPVPYRNTELAWTVATKPPDQLEGRREEILKAIKEKS